VALGAAWFLEKITPDYAVSAILGGFLVLTVLWAVSMRKLRAALARATEDARQKR
jgi:hypothetical protein